MISVSYRLGVASRAAAALFGGYAVSALAAICIALLLPTRSDEAVMTGMLLSFAIYTAVVIWVFAARTAWQAWIGILAVCLLLSGIWTLA